MVAILPAGLGDPAGKTHLFWPLAFYWVVTSGQITVIPVGQAFVSREAPKRLANTMLGVWLLFGGVGAWVSGAVGALTEPFGIRGVYLGIAVGCTLAGRGGAGVRKSDHGAVGAVTCGAVLQTARTKL